MRREFTLLTGPSQSMFDIAEITRRAPLHRVISSTTSRARGLALATSIMLATFALECHAALAPHTPGTLANRGFEGHDSISRSYVSRLCRACTRPVRLLSVSTIAPRATAIIERVTTPNRATAAAVHAVPCDQFANVCSSSHSSQGLHEHALELAALA